MVRVLGLVAVIAGCGRVGFDTSSSTDAVGVDQAAACTTLTFDTFPSNLTPYGVGTVTAEGGTLRIDFPGGDNTIAGIEADPTPLAGTSTVIRLAATDERLENSLGWHAALGGPYIHINFQNSDVYVTHASPPGPTIEPSRVAYNASMHRWFRMRDVNNVIEAATSPDGASWTTHAQVPAFFDLSAATNRWDFGIGRYGGAIAPVTVRFDDITNCM